MAKKLFAAAALLLMLVAARAEYQVFSYTASLTRPEPTVSRRS